MSSTEAHTLDLLPVAIAALITAVQLLVAAILATIWGELKALRARVHAVEGAQAITGSVMRELLARARRDS